MDRSILIPLDGSMFAEHALPIARSIALRTGTVLQLALVHVPIPVRYVEGVAIFDEALEVRNRERERAYLNEVVNRLMTEPNVSVTSTLLEGKIGKIAETLHDHATVTGVDLMVMTTHGRGGLARFWLGSVTDKLIRQALIPVLLIRRQEEE